MKMYFSLFRMKLIAGCSTAGGVADRGAVLLGLYGHHDLRSVLQKQQRREPPDGPDQVCRCWLQQAFLHLFTFESRQ